MTSTTQKKGERGAGKGKGIIGDCSSDESEVSMVQRGLRCFKRGSQTINLETEPVIASGLHILVFILLYIVTF